MSFLRGLFGPPNVEKLKAKGDLKGLIKALNYQEDSSVRRKAAEALEELDDPQAVEPLIAALEDNGADVRQVVAGVLGRIRDARAVEPLIAALKDRTKSVREVAAEALGEIGDPQAVEPLIVVLKDEDQNVRQAAAETLEKLGSPAVEFLITALQDEEWNVRQAIVKVLGQIGDNRAIEPLIAVLKGDEARMRKTAAEALDGIGWQPDQSETGAVYWIAKGQWDKCIELDRLAVEPLITALQDKEWKVRQATAEVLGQIGDNQAVEPLIATLNDRSKRVRETAAKALGQIGDIQAVEPLIAVLNDVDKHVREAATKALGQIDTPTKKCISCNNEIEALRRKCPNCGGENFIYTDFQKMPSVKQRAEEAAQLVDKGYQFLMQGHYVEAEKEFRKAIEINPWSDEAHNNMGVLLFKLGRYSDAVPWLEQAVELDPYDKDTLEDLNLAREKSKSSSFYGRMRQKRGIISSGQTISTRSEIAQRLRAVAHRCDDFTPVIAGIAEAIETGIDPHGKVAPSREEVAALSGIAEMLKKGGKQSEGVELVNIAKAVQNLIKL